jgi:hypothetical protein
MENPEWKYVHHPRWRGMDEYTRRMEVPGGWIYQTVLWPTASTIGPGQTVPVFGMVFVPQPSLDRSSDRLVDTQESIA